MATRNVTPLRPASEPVESLYDRLLTQIAALRCVGATLGNSDLSAASLTLHAAIGALERLLDDLDTRRMRERAS